MCKGDRISPAIRAREVFATEGRQNSAFVVETTDSRAEEAHSQMEMDLSGRELPRSPAKLGDELFYAITALRMSRLEIWRAGYTDCVAVLDEAYSLLYALGISMREGNTGPEGGVRVGAFAPWC